LQLTVVFALGAFNVYDVLPPSPLDSTAPAAACAPRGYTRGVILGEYLEPVSGHLFVVAEPAAQPELWAAYLEGARRSYRQHGVESAVEYDQVRDGRSTALFVAAIAEGGRVAGGLRVQGPLTHADQAHALREWAGRPGTTQLTAQITQRLPSGVIEVRAVWVDHDTDHRAALAAGMARAFIHAADFLHVRYALCTAAAHAVTRWQTSGGLVSHEVPAVAYPDERYRTMPMWWDRNGIADRITHDQHTALNRESRLLFGRARAVSTLWSVA
jgi:hypothetical protein